jgi:hypothetical protein
VGKAAGSEACYFLKRSHDSVTGAPPPLNAVDTVRTSTSRFPPPYDGLCAWTAPLFEGTHRLGNTPTRRVDGRRVLELGPLEGAHTHMLEQHGADSIVAVKANRSAYSKCLIT